MDFAETPRVRELSEKVWRFMDERIRPAEEEYWRGFSAETIPQRISPVMEELKTEARRRGLWNLFLPDKRFGPGLTNLEYGALAEIMGWSAIASEAMNCSAPGHRQHGGARAVRHARAAGDVAQAAARGRDPLVHRHDRARGRQLRSHPAGDAHRSRRR